MVKDIPLYLNSLKKGNRNNFSKKTRKMGILKSFVLGMVLSCSGLLNAQTAVPMSSQTNLTYTENFADITNWTNNFAAGIGANRWASVAINATGTLGDGVRTTVSTATFSTLTTGGVQKGTGNIVQLSTSTTNSNAIDFFMDFTGVNAGTVSFDVATIFNNTGDRDSRLKLFWSTNGTAWTELTGTNLPYTARNNVVGSGSVSVALPAAFNNSSTARLRFYEYSTTTGATPTGSQPKISVDNLVVKAIKINTTGALSALSTTYGTASSNTSFNVEAFNIGSNLSVTAPSGFEVSTTAVSGFASSISLTPASGNVALTTIYVRLAAATNAGTYSGDVVCAATGASTVNVATVSSTVSQASQTITFGTLSDVDEFDPDFNLTATASSGLTVTYSSSDPLVATVSGNTVTIVGDGTTTITASQSGNSNYTAASNVDQSLTVNAASGTPQTITFNALSNVTYGEADFNLTATASSALTVSYLSSNTAVATISGNTVTIVGPGTTTITASQAGDGSFQPAPDVDQSLTVDVKTLTVTGASANNKAYNKSTAATITGATLNGIVGLDVVTVSGGGTFDDANVANGINVTANLTLGGADAAKYTLNQPIGLTANITTKDISVTGISVSNKEYNGTNAAVLTGTASLSGVESGDNVNLDGTASAIFTDVNVNTAIPVTITGFSISGTSSGNYNLLAISGYTADIIAKALTVIGLSADDKTYDATDAATLTGTGALNGIVTGEEANVSLDGTPVGIFADANAATGKNVTVSGYSISGTVSGNYTLTPLVLSADITVKTITVSGASASDKAYDGTTTVTVSGGTLSGVETADNGNVSVSASGIFAQSTIGDNIAVTLALTGSASGNYFLTQPGITANITAAACANQTVAWNFTAGTAAISSSAITNLTVSNLSQGNNNGTTTLLVNGSVSSGYGGASGTFNAGAAIFSGTLNTATSTYFEFTLTPASGYVIDLSNISFGTRSTGTGPLAYAIRSSKDAYASNVASGTMIANSVWVLKSTATSFTSNPGTAVTFRIYGYNGTGAVNTANWRIDDLNLTVKVLPVLSSALTATVCDAATFTYTPTSNASGASYKWTRASVAGISNAVITTPQTTDPSEMLDNTTVSPVDAVYAYQVIANNCYNSQDVTVTVNPTLTASVTISSDDADDTFCTGTSVTFTATPTNGGTTPIYQWKIGATNAGTDSPTFTTSALADGDIVTVEMTSNATPCLAGSPATSTGITNTVIIMPVADDPSDVTACDSYTLPALTVGNYFTGTGGTGTALSAGNSITSSQTLYVYAETGTTPNCSDENSFVVTINATPTADDPADVTACDSYELLPLTIGNYFTGAGGTGTALSAGNMITSTQTIYVYAETGTTPNCSDENSLVVTINATPTTDDPTDVTACDSYTLPALTVGNYFTGTGGTGTALVAGNVITSTQTIYVYAETGTTPNCSDENSFVVTINATPTADDPADVTACDSYELLPLTIGNYFTGAGGTGTVLSAGNMITSTQTIYVYAETGTTPNCSDENSFVVTINATPTADDPADVTVCDSYTLPALTVGNYFTGSGGIGTALSAGNVISSTQTIYVYAQTGTTPNCADENSFVVTINNCSTQLSTSSCGKQLGLMTDALYSDPVAGATNYRYEVRKQSDNSLLGVSTRDINDNLFRLSWLSSSQYNTIYSIKVSAYVLGAWQAYGSACLVTSPHLTKLATASCGVTIPTLSTALYSDVVAGATNYRYEVRKQSDNSLLGVSTRGVNDNLFRMSWLSALEYNTVYSIKVSAYVGGIWMPYGTACTITTPVLTKLATSSCGITIASMSTALYSDAVAGATNYRYEVRKQSDNSLLGVSTRGVNDNLFRMSWLSASEYNTVYSIKVSAYVGGFWRDYGTACTITTPVLTKLATSSCGISIPTISTALYSDAVAGATNYRYEVRKQSDNSLLGVSTRGVNDNLFRLSWLTGTQLNTIYSIKVAPYVGGVWGDYGVACTVTTPSSMSKKPIEEINSEEFGFDFSFETYPNPNSGDFTISSTHEGTFNILNELGQLIKKVEITKENNFETKVEGLEVGVYFVTGTINNEVFTKKVIVVN